MILISIMCRIKKHTCRNEFYNNKYTYLVRSGINVEKINGRLIQVTDESRVKFRTNISQVILDQLNNH